MATTRPKNTREKPEIGEPETAKSAKKQKKPRKIYLVQYKYTKSGVELIDKILGHWGTYKAYETESRRDAAYSDLLKSNPSWLKSRRHYRKANKTDKGIVPVD